jgi:hypothetical protein
VEARWDSIRLSIEAVEKADGDKYVDGDVFTAILSFTGVQNALEDSIAIFESIRGKFKVEKINSLKCIYAKSTLYQIWKGAVATSPL